MSRRYKVYRFDYDCFLRHIGSLFRKEEFLVTNLPEDFRVVGVNNDYLRRCWVVAVASETFPEVPENQIPEEVDIIFNKL